MIKLFAYLPAVAVIATVALAQSAGAFTPGGAEWSDIGSGLPRTTPAVKSLAIDPATPSTLYAIDWDGRLFKSADSGESWTARGSLASVSSIAVDPTNSSTIYAATQHGLFKSTDKGEHWAGADSGLAGLLYASMIAIDPLTPTTLYATTTQGVFKSTDAARSWNKLGTLPLEAYAIPTDPYYFEGALTMDPVIPSTIYVGFTGSHFEQGIFKSTDGGQSWNRLDNEPGVNPFGLVVDPVTSSTLYARSSKNDGNIFKSTDGGQTWTVHPAAPPGTSVSALAIDPVSPSTLYAASSNGLGWGISKSLDSGENWNVLNAGPPPFADSGGNTLLLAISPTTPATVYTGHFNRDLPSGHLAKSTDGGATWNAVDAGLGYVDVRAVVVDPVIPSRIYAGMGGAGSSIPVFRSADGGGNWSNFAQFELGGSGWYGWISHLLVSSANPNSIYAAANEGDGYHAVFRTKDGGANWIRTGPAPFGAQVATAVVLDTADSNIIYLGDYEPTGEGDAILYKSVDGGATWTQSYEWDIGPVNALVIDPRNRASFYAGNPEGVFQSTDGGASWNNIGLSMGVSSLALDPGDPDTMYAATGGATYFGPGFLGLFKSTDGGASWAPVNNGLSSLFDSRSTVTAIAFGSGTVYLATSGHGVYKSLDSGATWEPFNEGLANLDVRLMAVASNTLYAVTSSGIFKATD